MKKESFAYGIAGGALSFFFAIMIVTSSSGSASTVDPVTGLPSGLLSMLGAVIGITGAVLIGQNKIIAAIMMVVAAAANLIDTIALGASIFLVIGAVLALISNKEEETKSCTFRTLSLVFSILGGTTLLFLFGSVISADMFSYIGQSDVVNITVIRLAAALVGSLGAIFIYRKRIVSAILMLAGAAAIIIAAPENLNVMMLSPCVLFVIGAVFAFIPFKKQPEAVAPAETEES